MNFVSVHLKWFLWLCDEFRFVSFNKKLLLSYLIAFVIAVFIDYLAIFMLGLCFCCYLLELIDLKWLGIHYIYRYICVCVCVCTCIHIHACMHAACIHTYIYIHACIYVCMYVCMYVYMYICLYIRMHACMHVCMQTYIHTYIHIYSSKLNPLEPECLL